MQEKQTKTKTNQQRNVPKRQKDNQISMGAKCIYSFLDNRTYAVYTVTYTFVLAHQDMQNHTSIPSKICVFKIIILQYQAVSDSIVDV